MAPAGLMPFGSMSKAGPPGGIERNKGGMRVTQGRVAEI